MPVYQCTRCERTDPPPKRCSACKKAWYCSPECQKRDWVCHIFDCKPTRELTTADYLALAVEKNLIPGHHQTCEEYGFFKGLAEEHRKLLSVYTALLHPNHLGIKPATVHRWRKAGMLEENIEKEFNLHPERVPTLDHQRFQALRHQGFFHIGTHERAHISANAKDLVRRAWLFTGGNPSASTEEMQRQLAAFPSYKRDCHTFIAMLLGGGMPSPEDDLWVSFAFCIARDREEERNIGRSFKWLMFQSTFEEFCEAHRSGTFIRLFKAKGYEELDTVIVDFSNPDIVDILTSTVSRKSVWFLKKYVELKAMHGPSDKNAHPEMSVSVDYGFINCEDRKEHDLLLDLYRRYFALGSQSKPLELHKACIGGRLFAYFTEDMSLQIKPKKVYKRLLQNPYPLPEY